MSPPVGAYPQRIASELQRFQRPELSRPDLVPTRQTGRILIAPESTGRAHVRRPLRLSGVVEREALAGGLE